MVEFITKIDLIILKFIQDFLQLPFLDFFFTYYTKIGNNGEIWILCGIILLFFKKYRKFGIMLLIALLVQSIIGNEILKPLIARERPFNIVDYFDIIIKKPTSYSFPSGHTMAAATAATVLTMANKKFAFFAIPLALLMGYSRLYLSVHYPSDVIAGAILGIAVGFFVVKISKKVLKTIKAKKA